MKIAAEELPLAQAGQAKSFQILQEWLQAVPVGAYDEQLPLEYKVSLTADLQQLTWWAAGLPGQLIGPMAAYFSQIGVSTSELERIRSLGEEIQPARLGSWMQMTPDSLDGGWYFPLQLPLTPALKVAEASRDKVTLQKWAQKHAVAHCAQLKRSMGAGYPYTEIQFILPGNSLSQKLDNGLALFKRLEAPSFSEITLSTILDSEKEELMASVWLASEGIAKVGLLLPTPSTKLMLKLCMTADINQDAGLAAFQGSLDVDGPAYIEAQHTSTGYGIELIYNLN